MKIFISHAIIDKDLALKLKDVIGAASMGLARTWLSSSVDGLKPGDNLWDEVHSNLSDSDKIIALLTPNSSNRPWILYESGFVAGNKKANVIPVLVSINKSDLPLPLSAYVTYNADDSADFSQLLVQLVAAVAPSPNILFINTIAEEFAQSIKPIKEKLDALGHKEAANSKPHTKVLSKLEASAVIHEKLSDPEVRSVSIIGYTNEVESGAIDHYRVKGEKRIEIFKRSILSDLWQQQSVNIARLINGRKDGFWNKRKKLIESTLRLEEEFSDNATVNLKHWFYDFAPTTRAYIFDENEALFSFYETSANPLDSNRSIYKGMGESSSVWLTRDTPYGQQILDGLLEEIKCLRLNSRSWSEENFILENPSVAVGNLPLPVLDLRAVFFDLDGLLMDTMPNYVEAWTEGFKTTKVEISPIDVYAQESNSSKRTVVELFKKYKSRNPEESEIQDVIQVKNQILESKPPALVMSGAQDMMRAIVRSGVFPFVVTSSKRYSLLEELDSTFPNVFSSENVITGNDVVLGKPYPDPYLIALSKANVEPSSCLVFENSPLGLNSARRAGINTFIVNSGPLSANAFHPYRPLGIFESCDEVANLWPMILQLLKE